MKGVDHIRSWGQLAKTTIAPESQPCVLRHSYLRRAMRCLNVGERPLNFPCFSFFFFFRSWWCLCNIASAKRNIACSASAFPVRGDSGSISSRWKENSLECERFASEILVWLTGAPVLLYY